VTGVIGNVKQMCVYVQSCFIVIIITGCNVQV